MNVHWTTTIPRLMWTFFQFQYSNNNDVCKSGIENNFSFYYLYFEHGDHIALCVRESRSFALWIAEPHHLTSFRILHFSERLIVGWWKGSHRLEIARRSLNIDIAGAEHKTQYDRYGPKPFVCLLRSQYSENHKICFFFFFSRNHHECAISALFCV